MTALPVPELQVACMRSVPTTIGNDPTCGTGNSPAAVVSILIVELLSCTSEPYGVGRLGVKQASAGTKSSTPAGTPLPDSHATRGWIAVQPSESTDTGSQ